MADPLTLTVLGTVAATEGIRFLYGQTAELLKSWRERRNTADRTDAEPLAVPIEASPVLDGQPLPHPADAEVLSREHNVMLGLSSALSPVAQGLVDLDVGDPILAQQAGDLRELLEDVYHQRITFRGESRERTGTAIMVRQQVRQVKGSLIGAEGEASGGASLTVDQDLGSVEEGGSATGFKGTIGR